MAKQQSSVSERQRTNLREPRRYKVYIHNDDFTTMDFVVSILIQIFKKDPVTAEQLMMQVHKGGRAVVGVYPYDIAITKTNEAMQRAKNEGFPFRMLVTEV